MIYAKTHGIINMERRRDKNYIHIIFITVKFFYFAKTYEFVASMQRR